MHRFRATLASGNRRPYSAWTFLVIPPELARRWGPGRKPIRGTIAGHTFRGIAARGEGVLRMPIPRAVRKKAGLARGVTVVVAVELDNAPRPVRIPAELRAVFARDPAVATLFTRMAPAHRRAWAEYVGEAKLPETRARRAARAGAGIRARAFPR